MRRCSPRCECGLIILLSSSNKAAGEINGYRNSSEEERARERERVGRVGVRVGDLEQQMPNL